MRVTRGCRHSNLPVKWITIRRRFTDPRWYQMACQNIAFTSLFPDLVPCDFFPWMKNGRGNDSQVPKKCSQEGTGGCSKRRLAIRICIFV
ncbi:hypothetical protein AVEN_96119-1 [Araneus ventricosus]|uniref:Uncharacterized protein n=1 Tax=Araneus ventricosus TaxID=182803 RepID=A0A4Y2G2Q4_ARAVE|nr:hypothetical protein AVEN_96119-1 [Araneus ventricosus]